MSRPISFGRLEVNLVSAMEETHGLPEPETPFRIAVLGDFSARENRGIFETGPALAGRRLLFVDRDNFDEVLAGLGVEVRLPIEGNGCLHIAIRFGALDDFHPDRIFERLDVFRALRETRRRLVDPRTFASAASELQNWARAERAPGAPEPAPGQRTSTPAISGLVTGRLLDHVLEETQGHPTDTGGPHVSEWDSFLQKIVTPYLVPKTDPQRAELVASVDAATTRLMRTILHHPDFQAIEAAWRAAYFLVSRLETDGNLKLSLLDVSRAELAADLGATEDLRSSGIYGLLVRETVDTAGAEPWAVLAGSYFFEKTREDAELLGRIAKIAREAGAPFISAASPRILGCESLAEAPVPDEWKRPDDPEGGRAWQALRRLPDASYLGLALPRFLLRLPYGPDTDPAEQFDFEEMLSEPGHDQYLWGNPAFACVYVLAQTFSRYGWDLRPGAIQDIEGLPLHIFRQRGGPQTKPCAEVVLTVEAVEAILDKGLIPLLAFRDRDTLRIARFQSLADPPAHLAGRWSLGGMRRP